jgi:hypothetical protein
MSTRRGFFDAIAIVTDENVFRLPNRVQLKLFQSRNGPDNTVASQAEQCID